MSTTLSNIGGPSSTTVDVDKGIAGIPGTQFYLSNGNPNDPATLPGVVPRRYDICTNIDPADSEYLFLYQYNYLLNPETGLPQIDPTTGNFILAWIPGFKLVPNTIAKKENVTFALGQADLTLNIELPPGYSEGPGGLPSNFDLQFEITTLDGTGDQVPVASTYKILDLSLNENIVTVNVRFGGVELVNGIWLPITGDKVIHLLITVV